MKRHFFIIGVLFCLSGFLCQAQEGNLDSLKLELSKAAHDTLRCNILEAMIEAEGDDNIWPLYNQELKQLCEKNLRNYRPGDPLHRFYKLHLAGVYNNEGFLADTRGDIPKALDYYQKSLDIEEEFQNTQGIATSLNNMGAVYQFQGETQKAIDYYQKSLALREQLGDQNGIAESLNNIGLLYDEQGNLSAALDCYQKARKIQEKAGDQPGLATTLINIGTIYVHQNDLDGALAHYEASLKIQEKLNNPKTLAGSLHNVASVYYKKGDYPKALQILQQSLDLALKTGNIQGIAHCYNSMGSIYQHQGKLDLARQYWKKAFDTWEKVGDKQGMALTANHLAIACFETRDYQQAKTQAELSLRLAQEIGYPANILSASRTLSQIYEKMGNWKAAYQAHVLYKQMNDSVNNENKRKSFLQKSLQFEYEKKVAADSIKASEARKVFDAQLHEQKVQRTALFVGIGLVTLFALFMYNRFRVTRRQKHIIELKEQETKEQKLIIEEKHKEISDSIQYAERIQRSFLATSEVLTAHLKDYFILFKPKAVVSGDFYWAAELSNGNFVLVTADSTGHGVPGAIMSLLNITSLEKAIEQSCEPAEILNLTRATIINRLKRDGSEEGGKDGMDCSLVVFDRQHNKIQVAAANNPVWIVRNHGGTPQLVETGFDKIPVGKHDKDHQAFTTYTVDVQAGDMVYTVTDGFSDQFGGERGKKFMQKRLKELVMQVSLEPTAAQKERLEQTLRSWIGGLEQIDDITVIGIRI